MIDVDRLREDFPILKEVVHGNRLVYLDNAATTQKPRAVIDALVHYYEHDNANIHRGIHALSVRATEQYEATRARTAEFIGAGAPESIVFTRNATEAINLVAHAWARANLHEGDEVVLTSMEHHSNIVPWHLLARDTGVQLRFARFDGAGRLDMDHLRSLIGPRTKLVSVVHASNVLGTINPVADIVSMAHEAGARVLIDGAQSVPHMPIDVGAMGCDFFVFSAHKMYGPTGVGVLYAPVELLGEMGPFLGGGEMISVVRESGSTWADVPHRFEAGTPNIADVVAFKAAIDYLDALGMEQVAGHERELTGYALEQLQAIPGLQICGPPTVEQRGGAISFSMAEAHPHDISTIVDRYGVAIRAGHHCAQLAMRELGVPATTRASLGLYSGRDDVDALVESLGQVRKVFGDDRARSAVR